MEKDFAEERKLVKTYGRQMADKVMLRMGVLKNAPNLAKVPTDKPERCHALAGDRNGQYSVDLVQPNRLIFEPDHDPVPKLEDGGTDRRILTRSRLLRSVIHIRRTAG